MLSPKEYHARGFVLRPWEHLPKLRWTDFSELSKLCFQFAGGEKPANEVQ
jgi:hypothetical protein